MKRLWSLLVLVLLCALAACTRQSMIRKDIQNGNTAALMQFVRDNAGNLKERDNIFFAVDEAVRNGSPAMLASIEDLYFDKAVSDEVRAHVLDAFAASHKATSNSARLFGALSKTDPNGADFQKFVTFMQRSPVAERKSLATNNLFSSLNATSCDGDKSGRKALQLATSILPEKTDDLAQIKSDFEIATDSVCKLQDLRETIESSTSDMHQWDEFLKNKPFS